MKKELTAILVTIIILVSISCNKELDINKIDNQNVVQKRVYDFDNPKYYSDDEIKLMMSKIINIKFPTSDEVAFTLGLSRGTVVHHIKRLIDAGLVIYSEGRYMLRVDTLKSLINELQKDMNRTFEDLKEIATDLDERLGL